MSDAERDFCLECGSPDISPEISPVVHLIKGREVRVEHDVHVRCHACGEVSYPGDLLGGFMRAVSDQMRREDGLLTVDELKTIRLRYGFTQDQMETLIGAGEKTWVRWERGKVTQSKQYDNIIRRIETQPDYVSLLMDEHDIDCESARAVIADATERSRRRIADEIRTDLGKEDASIDRIVNMAMDRFRTVASQAFDTGRTALAPAEVIARHSRSCPVDVDAIALDLGLKVHRDPNLGRDISGRIQKDSAMGGTSGYSVWISSREVLPRQRFTLAHEIAHFVLHASKIGDGISENALHRGPFSNPEEREANSLAAKILMPEQAVRDAFERTTSRSELARMFNVSNEAMKIRLEELRLS